MLDSVVREGDMAVFDAASFQGRTLIGLTPYRMKGSSHVKSDHKAFCLAEDADPIEVMCDYAFANFATPGKCKLVFFVFQPRVESQTAKGPNGQSFILQGQGFKAQMMIQVPAIDPATGTPDPNQAAIIGMGKFQLAAGKTIAQLS